ncbi:ABC transporter substrate-binding protein [Haliea sp.]|uniref:ABC transporter substrate-binding protein n=1 Tax=Haliea sp. TaxID=1932666 RepID=UPI0025BAF609|nr:ABC transporter substrate-binding protein [Haliea sp.]|tara:strand:+ start:158993 stop:161167 length:2175 start_codon:yes stop_codon:yes gene_type:complete
MLSRLAAPRTRAALLLIGATLLAGCTDGPWNNPNPDSPPGLVTYQSVMTPLPPKHLDPALSYAADESLFLMQIYEPPMGYHYLKRPYELLPLGVEDFPEITYINAEGEIIDPQAEDVAYSVYELTVRADARYQPHPAFALDDRGAPRYLFKDASESRPYRQISDFPELGSRPVAANDYVYAIKRLADPFNASPMLGFMAQYIVGMEDFSARLKDVPRDGWVNLDDYRMDGLEVVDDRTFRITIKGRYPQFSYWLAMHFFSPIAPEVDRFFHNPGFLDRNLTLDWWPVGSGPFMMVKNDPNSEIVLERNPNFREDYFPTEGAPGDAEQGLLEDAGKRLPLIDRAVFRLEKEVLSLWTKFLQGYYDRSGESHGNTNRVFDQAFVVGPNGVELGAELASHGITVSPDVKPAIYYYGFNMRDPVLGGYTEERRKLRRALQIAFDTEEYLKIFYKGNGIPAQSPIPPGIPGFVEGEAGINPYVYDWVDGAPKRKSIEHAKQLLTEAGYPNGRDARTGEPLKIFIDVQSQAISSTSMNWMDRAFGRIGVQVEYRPADWNRTREKLLTGNTQIFSHGWLADYPDPENFLFLLYGPESPLICNCDGANNASYERPEYDDLFRQMRVLPAGEERDALVARMVDLYREDAVWLYGFYPKDIYLNNPWVHNNKRHGISKNTLKYVRIDDDLRERKREEWNQPVIWPLYAMSALLVALLLPGIIAYRRRLRATARQ